MARYTKSEPLGARAISCMDPPPKFTTTLPSKFPLMSNFFIELSSVEAT